MLIDVIYSLFFAVTASQGRKGLRRFLPHPDVIFLRNASNPICLCLLAGRDQSML